MSKEVYREYDLETLNLAAEAIIALSLGITHAEFLKQPDGTRFNFHDVAEVMMGLLCFMTKGDTAETGQKLKTALPEYVGEYLLNAVSAGEASIGDISEIH